MSQPAYVRIAVCSDTHFWPGAARYFGSSRGQLQPHSAQIRASLLTELKAAAPDLIFHLGDLTCGGGTFDMPCGTFYSTLDATYDAFQALPGHFSILPGNHDCPAGGDWSYAEQRFGLDPGLGKTIDLPMARLVLLNAQGHSQAHLSRFWPGDPVHGWVNEAELARLRDALATAGERPVLIFIHQLLRPWVGEQPWQDLYGVQNAADVLAILARYGNVRAVFQAHAHRLDLHRVTLAGEECWFVVGPAAIEYPLAWLQLDLSVEQLQVTMQRLPLPDLAALSLKNSGDHWRAGQTVWRKFTIPLLERDEGRR